MTGLFYILENRIPKSVKCEVWAKWLQEGFDNRRVASSSLMSTEGEVWISTVFLGLDHNYNPNYKFPILFETLISGGIYDGRMDRYSTWDESLLGHRRAVKLVGIGIIKEGKSVGTNPVPIEVKGNKYE